MTPMPGSADTPADAEPILRGERDAFGRPIRPKIAVYDYSFRPHPHARASSYTRAMFTMFPRVEMTFTDTGWSAFVDALARDGIEPREVERIPHHDPEPV